MSEKYDGPCRGKLKRLKAACVKILGALGRLLTADIVLGDGKSIFGGAGCVKGKQT